MNNYYVTVKKLRRLLLKLRHSRGSIHAWTYGYVIREGQYTRVDLGLRDPFRVCGTTHARGLFSGRVGSTHCVTRFVLHFHAWHVGMTRRVELGLQVRNNTRA